MTTTLNKINTLSECNCELFKSKFSELMGKLGKDKFDNEPIAYVDILKLVGMRFTAYCLYELEPNKHDDLLLFYLYLGHYFMKRKTEYEQKVMDDIYKANVLYIKGKITETELNIIEDNIELDFIFPPHNSKTFLERSIEYFTFFVDKIVDRDYVNPKIYELEPMKKFIKTVLSN